MYSPSPGQGEVNAIGEGTLARLRLEQPLHPSQPLFRVVELVLPTNAGRWAGLDRFHGELELALEPNQVPPVLRQVSGREVATVGEALQMLGARIDRE
ncbi:hypothetical protein PO002_45390 [Cupriavidus necator]|uniref:hypothetical protein n=1 Tax=Cupriavidus necator TaxID=106590 RepID=UPI0039C26AD2